MEKTGKFENLLSIDELRMILGIGRNTAYSLLNDGSIEAIKIGGHWRVPESSITKYLQGKSSSQPR